MQKNDDDHQSRFLEAPFVRMLRMRSASLKTKWYKSKKFKKLALDSQLLTVQILTNDVQVLESCLSYFITTVLL